MISPLCSYVTQLSWTAPSLIRRLQCRSHSQLTHAVPHAPAATQTDSPTHPPTQLNSRDDLTCKEGSAIRPLMHQRQTCAVYGLVFPWTPIRTQFMVNPSRCKCRVRLYVVDQQAISICSVRSWQILSTSLIFHCLPQAIGSQSKRLW